MTEWSPLSVDNLSKTYGKHVALSRCSFRISAGRVHGLLGPNGSGKSTALHIIAGIIAATSGNVTICGVNVKEKASRLAMGFAPDDLDLPTYLTGTEFLELHHSLRECDDGGRAAALSERLGLDDALSHLVSSYSHGMKRKLQIIAALMHDPTLVVFDEPFRGLDPHAANALRYLLAELRRAGAAVLIATHDMLRAERDCDEVTILHQGGTVADGAPAELIDNSAPGGSLEDVFLSLTTWGQRQVNGTTADDSLITRKLFAHRNPDSESEGA